MGAISVSPEFLGFPADLEVLVLLGDPERRTEDKPLVLLQQVQTQSEDTDGG